MRFALLTPALRYVTRIAIEVCTRMFFNLLILSSAVIVGAVRYLLVSGIGRIGAALKFSAKVRGQMIAEKGSPIRGSGQEQVTPP